MFLYGETILSILVENGPGVFLCSAVGWPKKPGLSVTHIKAEDKTPLGLTQPAHNSVCSDVKICLESTSPPSEATPKLNILPQPVASVDDCVMHKHTPIMHKHTRGGCAKWFLSCSARITSIQRCERANHLVGKYSSILCLKYQVSILPGPPWV